MERYLAELFVRGLVLCLLAAAMLLLFRRAASAYRHLICVLALCGLVILPPAQRWMPLLPLLSPAPAFPTQPSIAIEDATKRSSLHNAPSAPALLPTHPLMTDDPMQSSTLLSQDKTAIASGTTALKPALHPEHARSATALLLSLLWGLGAATLLIRLIVALVRLRRLERESRDANFAGVSIRTSDRIETPLTWGIRRHIILLPTALLSADSAVCETAIRHEQAHIDRGDWVWNLFAEIVCALCWFQPGVWWLRRRMRFESERACDDRVLLSGIVGPDYAAHLLQIVQSVHTSEVAPAMAPCGGLEDRMRHILDTQKPRRTSRLCLALAAPLGIGLLSLATLRLSARPAETKSTPDTVSNSPRTERPATSPQASTSTPSAEVPGAPEMADPAPHDMLPDSVGSHTAPKASAPSIGAPQKNNSPLLRVSEPLQNSTAALTTVSEPASPTLKIVWGKAVEGLEPGFMRITPAVLQVAPAISTESHVVYQVLVRNATRQERTIEAQCQAIPPHWISDDNLKKVLSGNTFTNDWSVVSVTDLAAGHSGIVVKLAPGEAVVLPETMHLYLDDAPDHLPRVRQLAPGKHWIVQPMLVRSLTPSEAEEELHAITSPYGNGADFTILTRDGSTIKRRGANQATQSVTKIFANLPLEIPAANAVISPVEKPIQWGEVKNGFQLGARTAQSGWAFHTGDVIKLEAFGRNQSGKDTDLTVGNYWKVNYKIQVQTLDGQPIYMERNAHNQAMLVAGYRLESFVSGATEQISEAHLKITLPSATQPTVATYGDADTMVEAIPLKPGRYRVRLLSWRLFGTQPDGPASAWIPFEVKS